MNNSAPKRPEPSLQSPSARSSKRSEEDTYKSKIYFVIVQPPLLTHARYCDFKLPFLKLINGESNRLIY